MLACTLTSAQVNAIVQIVTSMQSSPKSVLFDEAWYQYNTRSYYDIRKGLREKYNAIWQLQSTELGLDSWQC